MEGLTFAEGHELLGQPYCCLKLVTCSWHIAMPPRYLGQVRTGVVEQLNSELKMFSQRLDGVMVAYNNIRIKQNMGAILEEEPFIHFDIQAEFIVFQPTIGSILKGTVNKVGKDHIGCLVHRCYNASVPKHQELEEGQELLFEVTNIFMQNDILSIRGKAQQVMSPCKNMLLHTDTITDDGQTEVPTVTSKKKKKKRKRDEVEDDQEHGESQGKKNKRRKKDVLFSPEDPLLSESVVSGLDGSYLENFHKTSLDGVQEFVSSTAKKKKKHKKRLECELDDVAESPIPKYERPGLSQPDVCHGSANDSEKKRKKKDKHEKKSMETVGAGADRDSDITVDSGIGCVTPSVSSSYTKKKKKKHKHANSAE